MKALALSLMGGLRLPLMALGVAAIVAVVAYQTGINAERKRGEANVLRQQLETIVADKAAAERAAASSARMAQQLEAEARAYQEELDDLRHTIAARPESERRPASARDLDLIYGGAQ